MKRFRCVFAGTVQGVGFRYRAVMAARKLGLTGWVSNMPDGTVVMEVQGEKDTVGYMTGMLLASRYGRVELAEKAETDTVEETGFRVIF